MYLEVFFFGFWHGSKIVARCEETVAAVAVVAMWKKTLTMIPVEKSKSTAAPCMTISKARRRPIAKNDGMGIS